MSKTFYLVSLGCPKNEVDAEAMLSYLDKAGFDMVRDPSLAEFLIVNTCAFINSAKEEAIEHILALADDKAKRLKAGLPAYLVVTGCLSQRYAKDIYQDLPEVDLALGTAEYHLIVEALAALQDGKKRTHLPQGRGSLCHLEPLHTPSQDRPYAYLKISEGCSNGCAFCAIPAIRGGQQSRSIEAIVAEARHDIALGFKEIILVAQDTTRYGTDLYGKQALCDLLRQLVALPGDFTLRLMYVYGDAFSDELIDLIAREDKISSYIDLPVQHGSDRILKKMGRRETQASILALIRHLRANIPDLILRSTVMVGFPGETADDFQALKDLVQMARFDRLGCFIYSAEEGTLAARMPDRVDPDLAQQRYDEIMQIQQQISLEANRSRVGETYDVVIDGYEADSPFFLGRSYGEAPEVDPYIYVLSEQPNLDIGSKILVRIVDADAYGLTAVSADERR